MHACMSLNVDAYMHACMPLLYFFLTYIDLGEGLEGERGGDGAVHALQLDAVGMESDEAGDSGERTTSML